MADQQLINYIRQLKGKYSDQALKNALKQQGYSAKDVNEAFAAIDQPPGLPLVGSVASQPSDGSDDKLFAVLGYLGILVIIPLVMKKDRPFVLFHAKQGLVLLIIWVIIFVISLILSLGLFLIPFIGWILSMVVSIFTWILYMVILVVVIIGIVNAATGKQWRIPIVARLADKMKF